MPIWYNTVQSVRVDFTIIISHIFFQFYSIAVAFYISNGAVVRELGGVNLPNYLELQIHFCTTISDLIKVKNC